MAVSRSIENFLSVACVDYQKVTHGFTETAYDSACSADVDASQVVKAVMLKDPHGEHYTMALLPASNILELGWLPGVQGGMHLASEEEFDRMFPDCARGAVPGFGQAFHVDMVWEDELLEQDDLYFEGGDHRTFVQIAQKDFRELFSAYPHQVISMPR